MRQSTVSRGGPWRNRLIEQSSASGSLTAFHSVSSHHVAPASAHAAGVANALSIQFLNNALFVGSLLTTMPIVSATPIFTLLLGVYWFGRETISWRTVATIALIVPGVTLVALAGVR